MVDNAPADGVTGRPSARNSISVTWRAWTLPERESQALSFGFGSTTPRSRPIGEIPRSQPGRTDSPTVRPDPLRIGNHQCGKRHARECRHQVIPPKSDSRVLHLHPRSRARHPEDAVAPSEARRGRRGRPVAGPLCGLTCGAGCPRGPVRHPSSPRNVHSARGYERAIDLVIARAAR